MDELKKRYEENPRRFFAPLANEYRKSGDIEQAISLCEEHLGDQPGNMNGQVVYGQALFDAGRLDDAETTFGTALALDPENLIALRHLGDIARTKNDAPKAVEWYKRVLDADPRNDEILGFIEELKAASPPAAPTPISTPAVPPRASTPIASPAVTPSEAKTVEISAPPRPSVGTPTPIAPIAAVQPQEPKRPSIPLMDMSLDFASEPEAAVPPPPPAPSAPSAPVGDLELTDMSFGDPEPAPAEATIGSVGPSGLDTTGSSFETPSGPAPSGESDHGAESSLGWEMGGNIDLDAPHADAGTSPNESATPAETPQVFVTETMAELYLQQGFRDEALQVYRQLAEMNPNDASLRDRIKHLESGDRASISLEALPDVTPDFAPGTDSLIEMSEQKPAPDAATAAANLDAAMPSIESFTDSAMDLGGTDLPPRIVEEAPLSIDDVTPVAAVPALPAPASVAAVTARSYFAQLAQRRAVRADGTAPAGTPVVPPPAPAAPALSSAGGPIESLFGASSIADANDDAMAMALATAVGAVDAPVLGRPTQAAASELTLDSVFRGEAPIRSSGPVRKSSVLKFDQFFESGDAAPADAGASPVMPPAVPPAVPPEPAEPASPADDAQFNSWLQGLKGE